MSITPTTYSQCPQFGRYPSEEDRLVMSSRCPLCACDCDDIYLDSLGQELGCNQCITAVPIHQYRLQQLEDSGKRSLEEADPAMSSQCPHCECDCDVVYVDDLGQAVGCNRCITVVPIYLYRLRKLAERGERNA